MIESVLFINPDMVNFSLSPSGVSDGNGIANRNTHYLFYIFSHQRFITCLWKNAIFKLSSPDFGYIAFITTAYRYFFPPKV